MVIVLSAKILKGGGISLKSVKIALCMLSLITALSSCQFVLDNFVVRKSILDNRYEVGNLNILVELGIVTDEELSKDTYITNLEVLQIIRRIVGGSDIDAVDDLEISEWYLEDILSPLDDIDDTYKKLFLDLSSLGLSRNLILTNDDILNIKLGENITHYESLVFITRMIGDTYGCIGYQEEVYFTEKAQTYEAAFIKGVIDDTNIENADLPILRKDFFDIIHKAIFVEYDVGSDTLTTNKHIDQILSLRDWASQQKETVIHTNQILAKTTINDDMSLSWVVADEYKFLKDSYYIEVQSIASDGTITVHSWIGAFYDTIFSDDIIMIIASEYPAKIDCIRYIYYKYDGDYQTKDEWYLDFDISGINAHITGEEINPGVYTHIKRQWVPEKISLSQGNFFKENAYYLLTSYEHRYRNDKYNSVCQAIFKATETSDTYYNSNGTGRFPFQGSVVDVNDIHIQEIIIQGNAASGFTLYITPESKEIFEALEGSEPS